MVWLVTHMWIGLALAALFGLIFGWAFRGLQLKGRARDAMVARDIALTELEQSRLEVDQLYAAQNKGVDAAAQAGDEALQRELEAREEKLQALSKELASSQNALEDLKSKAVAGAGVAAAVSGVTGAALGHQQSEGDGEDRLDAGLNANDASLAWRNRYLASRVRALEAVPSDAAIEETPVADPDHIAALEADLAAAKLQASDAESALEAFKAAAENDKQSAISLALAASGAGAVAGAVLGQGGDDSADATRSDGPDLGLQKRDWQNTYLRRRLASAQLGSAPAEEATLEAEERLPVVASPVEEADTVSDSVQAEKQAWQNDYLRRRMAYMEHNPPKDRRETLAETDEASVAAAVETNDAAGASDAGEPVQSGADVSGDAGELEQELARLRWRNRYLEGRLAYIDGDQASAEATPDALAHDAPVTSEPETADTPMPTPAEAVMAAMDSIGGEARAQGAPEKPEGLEQPSDNGDDLTRIEGVDVETATALNALGIWHFHQIAGWTQENTDWINAHFEAKNRVERQEWVGQAGALSLGAAFN